MEYVVRAGVMYITALLMIRLLGKRALGELGPFDFVVMTGVGHTVVSFALDKSIHYYDGFIILATLAGLEYLMGYLALKNQTLSNLITGRPVVLIENGRIIKENLKKEKFNTDDLLQELRKQGIRDIDEVERGILESCGGFSVIRKELDEPVTRRDLGIKPVKRTAILTAKPLKRKEFFELQSTESQQGEPEVSIGEMLKNIEANLASINMRLEKLERDLKS